MMSGPVRLALNSPKALTIICMSIMLLIAVQVAHAQTGQPKVEEASATKKEVVVAPKAVVMAKKAIPAPEIPKILNVDYDADSQSTVVPVLTKLGFATQLFFAPGERIEACAAGSTPCVFGGDSDGWVLLGKVGDDSITLKPGLAAANTNLLVKTNLYRYAFDLRVLGEKEKQNGNWTIAFQHSSIEQSPAEKGRVLLDERLNSSVRIKRNTNYTMQKIEGTEEIIPNQVWDDGRFTYIRIPNNRSIPTIFKVAPDNQESMVESHLENDVLVAHQVAPRWVLRLSNQVVGIWNESYDPDGVPAVNGTTIPGVIRVVKGVQK